MKKDTAYVICGPTASGKTDFAHRYAKNLGGEIICADSKQLYDGLPLITASPGVSLKSEIPYLLYNFCNFREDFSAPKYAELAAKAIYKVLERDKLPILVGGSGMYISALIYGYSKFPAISEDIHEESLRLFSKVGKTEFYKLLTSKDPFVIDNILPSDTQRMIRAYDIFQQTGKSIIVWQRDAELVKPLSGLNLEIVNLNPNRQMLYSNCNDRFLQMINSGAIEEIRSSYDLIKNASPSVYKIVGVREILSYLEGHISLSRAIDIAQAKTRQYAKRQVTWFKNKFKHSKTINYSSMSMLEKESILY